MKTIKLTSILLILALLLCACGTPAAQAPEQTTSEPEQATSAPEPTLASSPSDAPSVAAPSLLTLEEYPLVDGSTANLPLMAAVMARVTGIDPVQAETLSSCTTTPYAYAALVEGTAELLLVYEPAEETYKMIEQSGAQLEFTPIGRDALVFIANESNPVAGLTTQQLIDIYTGKITSWKDVGGNDKVITAFQRASASGSQALFRKLLMKDVKPMDAPTELYPSEMGELIEAIAEYNNDGGALGFSVFYYANYMYTKPGLKFIAVDGVMPSDATIADASYPFINEFYAVVRKDSPVDSPERKVVEWLKTNEGTQCIQGAGYIPVR